MRKKSDTALIITQKADYINSQKILGTGGWISHEEREEADWMILIRFLGWRVIVVTPSELNEKLIDDESVKWIILAGDPDTISNNDWKLILIVIKIKQVLFLSRAGKKNGIYARSCFSYKTKEISSGKNLHWTGNGNKIKYRLRKEIQIPVLKIGKEVHHSALLEDNIIVSSINYGKGKLVTFSFHPGYARDQSGYFTTLLKNILIYESLLPIAWYNWENTVILRMDDPGSLEVVYNEIYKNEKLGRNQWNIIGKELKKRNARMSLGYVAGWVDDGDEQRGSLLVAGKKTIREKGKVHPSPLIIYKENGKTFAGRIFDFQDEYKGIQKLRKEGLVEVEVHGFTHLHPDRLAWASAADRYTNTSWFREFGTLKIDFLKAHPRNEHPLKSGIKAVNKYFKTLSSTLICPGDEFTNDVLEKTLKTSLMIVSSYYLAIRIKDQLCWAQHICSPYLDKAATDWFEAPLPVVGYFHDFDISIHGTKWFSDNLTKWEKAGAKYFIDFREVASLLNHYLTVNQNNDEFELTINAINDFKLIKPARIGIYIPGQSKSSELVLQKNKVGKPIKI